MVAALLLIPIHEAIHAFAARMLGHRWDKIRLGFDRKFMIPYCHLSETTTIGKARIYILAPFLLLTSVAAILCLLTATPEACFLFALSFSVSSGDLAIFWPLRKFNSADQLVGETELSWSTTIVSPES